MSLNAPLSTADGAAELGDLIGADDPDLEAIDTRDALASAMRSLPPRDQAIIALRFFGNLGQAQIADRVGISQMHVSRLLTKSLTTMRNHLTSEA